MTNRPPPESKSRRVGYRLDWCASVELILDNRPDLLPSQAVKIMAEIYPCPFQTLKAYRVFRDTNRGKVSQRKPEIWQFLEHLIETGQSSEGATLEFEQELIELVGVRITERFNGLGLTHAPPGPPGEVSHHDSRTRGRKHGRRRRS